MNISYNIAKHTHTIDEAWQFWYLEIKQMEENGATVPSRDRAVVGEILNAVTVIEVPTRCILRNPIRKLPMRYCISELLWYLSGNNKLDTIRLYTGAWDRLSDNGKTVNSNYGYRIQCAVDEVDGRLFDQMKMCEELLRKEIPLWVSLIWSHLVD